MSQGFHQGIYSFPNAYERSAAANEWVIREQGGFDAPPPPPVFDAGGMLTEVINRPWRKPGGGGVVDDQIQPSQKQPQLSALAVNGAAAAEEVCVLKLKKLKYNFMLLS